MILPGLLRDHGEALEADFQRYYGLDLLDIYRGTLSPRKVAALAANLPAGAATWQEMGVDAAWTAEEHMLALIADTLQAANWQRGGGKGKQPKPLPRPADMKKQNEAKNAAFEQARAFKERQKLNRR